MSDAEAQAVAETETAEQVDPAVESEKPEQAAAEVDWKAKSREWERRAKENAKAAARLKDIEDSQKSELERAQERLQSLEAELRERDTALLRTRIAAEYDLPAVLASRITGSDEDEMREDAQRLLEELSARFVAKTPVSSEDTGQGAVGKATDYESMSPVELARLSSRR